LCSSTLLGNDARDGSVNGPGETRSERDQRFEQKKFGFQLHEPHPGVHTFNPCGMLTVKSLAARKMAQRSASQVVADNRRKHGRPFRRQRRRGQAACYPDSGRLVQVVRLYSRSGEFFPTNLDGYAWELIRDRVPALEIALSAARFGLVLSYSRHRPRSRSRVHAEGRPRRRAGRGCDQRALWKRYFPPGSGAIGRTIAEMCRTGDQTSLTP
jgi:hypothetical protein